MVCGRNRSTTNLWKTNFQRVHFTDHTCDRSCYGNYATNIRRWISLTKIERGFVNISPLLPGNPTGTRFFILGLIKFFHQKNRGLWHKLSTSYQLIYTRHCSFDLRVLLFDYFRELWLVSICLGLRNHWRYGILDGPRAYQLWSSCL